MLYVVYQVYREGVLLPEERWVKVRGEICYSIGGKERSPHKVADVLGTDYKPLLGPIDEAVVTEAENGHFAIEGKQKATHEKGMYWAKTGYQQVWLCVPVKE